MIEVITPAPIEFTYIGAGQITFVVSSGEGGGVSNVSSVFGRTGAITAAANDYSASDIANNPAGNITAEDVQSAINQLDDLKYPKSNPYGFLTYQEALMAAPVKSVSGKFGNVILDKEDVGLNNVDNTRDIDKPISILTKQALDGKMDNPTRKTALILESDCYSANVNGLSPFVGIVQGGGSIVQVPGEVNHPGVIALRDSATAGGGYRIVVDPLSILISGGERFICTFQLKSSRVGMVSYIGFFDNTNQSPPTDCCCLVSSSDGVNVTLTPRARSNNTAQDGLPFIANLNEWYTAVIEVNIHATAAIIEIYNDEGAILHTSGLLTNLPTLAGRQTGAGISAFESTTDSAQDLLWLDYMRLEINRILFR